MDTSLTGAPSLISEKTWAKIKSGAAVAGLAIGTIAICAVSTFACAYAQGYGHSKGTRDGYKANNAEGQEYSGEVPISSGFRRNIFERNAA